MIRKILDLISQKGFVSLRELSEETGLNQEIVRLLLEELEKRGKIKSCAIGESGCEGCQIKGKCSVKEKEKIYFMGTK